MNEQFIVIGGITIFIVVLGLTLGLWSWWYEKKHREKKDGEGQ